MAGEKAEGVLMGEIKMKVWITKYALTGGIFTVEAEEPPSYAPGIVSFKRDPASWNETAHGNDWHRSEAAALTKAEKMRVDKLASLRKQIAKLEKLDFSKAPT